ncbi:hypothetical protein [Agrobacterium tumefaciens]|uniref:hypothetical protein n=1 Tax=Agrobacterium tumefaciens TaxID=358 RepID=UPI001300E681
MFKRYLDKWKIWGQAFIGIDDIQGDQSTRMEARMRFLEKEIESLRQNQRADP